MCTDGIPNRVSATIKQYTHPHTHTTILYIHIQVWTKYSAYGEGTPLLHSCRSPRAKRLVSYESLAKFMRYFGAKI